MKFVTEASLFSAAFIASYVYSEDLLKRGPFKRGALLRIATSITNRLRRS